VIDSNVADESDNLSRTIEDQKALIVKLEGELRDAKRDPYRERPGVLRGRTVEVATGCGTLFLTLNEDENGKPFEVFFGLGKGGSCQQSYLDALGFAVSIGLRCGADPRKFIEKFSGIHCSSPAIRDGGLDALSCLEGIAKGLSQAMDLGLQLALLDPSTQ
jgi:ribonucleoside-diphosphate reductase alpha chain